MYFSLYGTQQEYNSMKPLQNVRLITFFSADGFKEIISENSISFKIKT